MPDLWQLVVALCTAISVGLFLAVARRVRRGSMDPFFGLFILSGLVYLEIGPAVNLVMGRGTSPFFFDDLTAKDYGVLQAAALVLFFPVAWAVYSLPLRPPIAPPSRSQLVPCRALTLCSTTSTLAVLHILEVVSQDLTFRRIGSEDAAAQIVQLPLHAYIVIRVFNETALFMVALLVFTNRRTQQRSERRWSAVALSIVTISYLIGSLPNSRLDSAAFIIAGSLWFVVLSRPISARPLNVKRVALVGVVIVVGLQVTLNARAAFSATLAGREPPAPTLYFPLSDVERIDCVDLIARTLPEIEDQGPALGAAWSGSVWVLRRYIDPQGFDEFREGARTTSKAYVLDRYANRNLPDYYSCSLTDSIANFYYYGFLINAIIFGFGFRYVRRQLLYFDSVRGMIIAMFICGIWLRFERETSDQLFGWLNAAPVLVLALMFPPMRLADRSARHTSVESPLSAQGR